MASSTAGRHMKALPPGGMPNPSSSFPLPKSVQFDPEPRVAVIEGRKRKMQEQSYTSYRADEVTESMLEDAARLFSENYGIWDERSGRKGPVKLGARRLRDQYLPCDTAFYTIVTVRGVLTGNAFTCRWKYNGKAVCWVTQLVVAKDYRELGLASGLLRFLREDTDDIYGIMSSHPASCLAAAKSFTTSIEKVPLDFVRSNAAAIMETSPIQYIRDASLCGSLFDPGDSTGLVSGVNTAFFVDHTEPLQALELVRQYWEWPLGDLPDGHEYLLVLLAKRRRSRSRSTSRPASGAASGS